MKIRNLSRRKKTSVLSCYWISVLLSLGWKTKSPQESRIQSTERQKGTFIHCNHREDALVAKPKYFETGGYYQRLLILRESIMIIFPCKRTHS